MQYLSIDVALGSVGSSVLAGKVVGARLPLSYWLMLPLCVWIIYTTDHLLDARKLKEKALMDRHQFHYVHRRILRMFLGLAMFMSVALMLTLHRHTIVFGACVYLFLLVYFLANQFGKRIFNIFPRELIIALGYMAGTWGIPLLSKYSFINRMDTLFFLNHFLIILSIPLLYSICEYEGDIAGGFVSFSTAFGVHATEVTVSIVLTIATVLSTLSWIEYQRSASIILLLMTLVLAVVFVFRTRLSIGKLRLISDSVNLFPFLLLT